MNCILLGSKNALCGAGEGGDSFGASRSHLTLTISHSIPFETEHRSYSLKRHLQHLGAHYMRGEGGGVEQEITRGGGNKRKRR